MEYRSKWADFRVCHRYFLVERIQGVYPLVTIMFSINLKVEFLFNSGRFGVALLRTSVRLRSTPRIDCRRQKRRF